MPLAQTRLPDGGQAPGALYYIMIPGMERRTIFKDDKDRDVFYFGKSGMHIRL